MSQPLVGPLRIRDYQPDDFQRLHQIDRICFPPDIAYSRAELLWYLRHPNAVTKVAEFGDSVVGFTVGRLEDNLTAHVLTLDVIPDARRRKVGTELMTALHNEFERQKIIMTFLEVDVTNDGARRFYESLHYKWVETLRGYYKGRRDAHRMVHFAMSTGTGG